MVLSWDLTKFGKIGARIGPPANHPEPCRNAAKVFVSWLGSCLGCGKIRDAPGKPVFSELASDFGGIRTRNSLGFRVGGAPPADPVKPARFASHVLVSWLGQACSAGIRSGDILCTALTSPNRLHCRATIAPIASPKGSGAFKLGGPPGPELSFRSASKNNSMGAGSRPAPPGVGGAR